MKSNLGRKGFSLVELMVVVAIIGLLAAIGLPNYSRFKVKARQAEAKTLLANLYTAEASFFFDYNGYHSNMNIIGFAPVGRVRYNVGFGAGGVITPNFTVAAPLHPYNSKEVCIGYGTGTDARCTFISDVPDIQLTSTVSPTSFEAIAAAYDFSLQAQAAPPSAFSLALEYVLSSQDVMAIDLPAGCEQWFQVDGWAMNEKKVLTAKLSPIAFSENQMGCNGGGPTDPTQ